MLTYSQSPGERAKSARSTRRFAITWFVFGLLWLAMGVASVVRHHEDLWFRYFEFLSGVFWLFMSWIYFKRPNDMRPERLMCY